MTREVPPPPRVPHVVTLDEELNRMAADVLRGMPVIPPAPRPVSAAVTARYHQEQLKAHYQKTLRRLRGPPADAVSVIASVGMWLLLFGPLLFLVHACFW